MATWHAEQPARITASDAPDTLRGAEVDGAEHPYDGITLHVDDPLASIVSVTLGVATLIVVNSVMSGFTTEMQDRIHGILSDIVFESHGVEGFANAEWHMQKIREVVGDDIHGMTPTVHVPAMLNFQVGGRWIHRQENFIGIDPATYWTVSNCAHYLQHPENRKQLSFALRDGGYDLGDPWLGGRNDPRRPNVRGRQPFGRITIANSDAGASAMLESAVREAHRAIEELK